MKKISIFVISEIIIFLIAVNIASCDHSGSKKYKPGDVVYMKPDSTKATILDNNVIAGEYEISYGRSGFFREFCNESDIYGPKK